MTTATKNTTTTQIEATTLDRMANGVMQVALGAMMSAAGLVGVWAVACMIAGIAKAGGIVELGRSYLAAIGM